LTQAGERFVRTVEQAFGAIADQAEQWRAHRGVKTLRLSVLPSFARLWLLPRLLVLQGDPPDLFLDIRTGYRLADLRDGEVDLAIRYGAGPWPRLQAELLFREELTPVATQTLAARLCRNPDPRAILQHPLLHDSDASQWRSWFARAGVSYRPRPMDRRFEDYDLVLEAAAAGVGVALIRLPYAADWLASGRLRRAARGSIPNASAHFAVTRRGDARPPVQTLLARLHRLVARSGGDKM
jgi:LysR family transcriptional regulator, glycine cleavage system transcriptional activator